MTIKAAGTVLTVAELREALAGLRDDDTITVGEWGPVISATPRSTGVELLTDFEPADWDEEDGYAIIIGLAKGHLTLKAAKAKACELLSSQGYVLP